MATVSTEITISSSDLFGSNTNRQQLSFTQSKDLSITPETSGLGTVTAPVSGGTAILLNADAIASQGHFWIKNNSSAVAVNVYRDSGSNVIAQLPAGGVMMAPVSVGTIYVRSADGSTTASVDYFFADLT